MPTTKKRQRAPLEPSPPKTPPAAWTAAVATAVIEDPHDVTLGAARHVTAKRRRPTPPDRLVRLHHVRPHTTPNQVPASIDRQNIREPQAHKHKH
jgi:hypothetical protein